MGGTKSRNLYHHVKIAGLRTINQKSGLYCAPFDMRFLAYASLAVRPHAIGALVAVLADF